MAISMRNRFLNFFVPLALIFALAVIEQVFAGSCTISQHKFKNDTILVNTKCQVRCYDITFYAGSNAACILKHKGYGFVFTILTGMCSNGECKETDDGEIFRRELKEPLWDIYNLLSLFHQSALAFGMETTGQRRRQSHWPLYERSCGSNQRPSMTIRRSIDCTVGKGKAECRPATLRPFRSRRDQRHQCPTAQDKIPWGLKCPFINLQDKNENVFLSAACSVNCDGVVKNRTDGTPCVLSQVDSGDYSANITVGKCVDGQCVSNGGHYKIEVKKDLLQSS
uniref:Putative evasin n=1 Tax=Ixodes ricinus TaxID=34613 RepID=A0A6B0V6U2_IXORI